MIMVSDRFTTEIESPRREIAVVIRKSILDGAAKNGLISCGGDLLLVRQAGGCAVHSLSNAEGARLCGIQSAKISLIAPLCSSDDASHFMGGLRHKGAFCRFHAPRFAGPDPHF